MIFKIAVKTILRTVIFSFPLIFIATPALAGEINLLPEGEKKPVSVELSLAEMSETLKNMIADLGGTSPEQSIPLTRVNLGTWNAIEKCLKEMQRLRAAGSIYQFKSMKEMVKNSFPTDAPTSTDILNFFLAVDFLHIPDLLRPAAAAWVDVVNLTEPKTGVVSLADTIKKFETSLKTLGAPNDLFTYVKDYINPTSTIKEINSIKVTKPQLVVIKAGDTFSISITKLATKEARDARTTEETKEPKTLNIEAGNKLYVINREDNTISAFDRTTKQAIDAPWALGNGPAALIIIPDTFYVVNWEDKRMMITTPKNMEKPPIDGKYETFASAGDKFYAIEMEVKNEYTLSVFDLTTSQLIGLPLKLTREPRLIIVAGDKLVAVNRDQSISIFDLEQFLYYTSK